MSLGRISQGQEQVIVNRYCAVREIVVKTLQKELHVKSTPSKT